MTILLIAALLLIMAMLTVCIMVVTHTLISLILDLEDYIHG